MCDVGSDQLYSLENVIFVKLEAVDFFSEWSLEAVFMELIKMIITYILSNDLIFLLYLCCLKYYFIVIYIYMSLKYIHLQILKVYLCFNFLSEPVHVFLYQLKWMNL